jgi:hypothetical protein
MLPALLAIPGVLPALIGAGGAIIGGIGGFLNKKSSEKREDKLNAEQIALEREQMTRQEAQQEKDRGLTRLGMLAEQRAGWNQRKKEYRFRDALYNTAMGIDTSASEPNYRSLV